ncbi:hypothetical protein [Thalassotalea profundi]|nr:hypothetical protein [Thalassotalea profundi]
MTRPNKNVRNNNPLNIRESAEWVGERTLNIDKEFEEFKTPEHGFRAGYIILLQYLERGDNTIDKIITKWAPASDNNHTNNYINYVANELNISEFQELAPKDLPQLMLAMSVFEGGGDHFELHQVVSGIELAHKESFVVARLGRLGVEVYV